MEPSHGKPNHTVRRHAAHHHKPGRRFASVIVLFAVISSVLAAGIGVTNPSPAYADHTRHSVKKEPASRYGYGQSHSWTKGTGGGTGSNGFYYAQSRTWTERQNYAIWWMGDLRGQYKLRVYVPRDGAKPSATASVKYRIQERTSSGNWRTVKSYRLNQSTSRGWRKFTTPVTLNGRIRILVRDYEARGGRIAIDSIELEWQRDRTIALAEAPTVDVVWEKWTLPFDDDDVVLWWEKVSNARRYQVEWRYLGFDTRELRKTYQRLFEETSESERKKLQKELQRLDRGYTVDSVRGNSRPNPGVGPDATCWVPSKQCKHWKDRVDSFNPEHPNYRVHSLQTHLLFQTRVRAINGSGTSGPWSKWASFPGMKRSITCIAFDIYNTIKDVQLALKAADFVLAVGAIGAAVFSGGTATIATGAIRQLLKEFVEGIVKNGIVKSVIRRVIKPLVTDYVKNVGRSSALRIFKVLAGCVTAGFELDGDHNRSLWKDILEESALGLPRTQIEDFLDAVW